LKLATSDSSVINAFAGAQIECEKENDSIYTFAGQLKLLDQDPTPLDID